MSLPTNEVGRANMTICILQLWELKFREVKFLPQGHTAHQGGAKLIKNKQAHCECSPL